MNICETPRMSNHGQRARLLKAEETGVEKLRCADGGKTDSQRPQIVRIVRNTSGYLDRVDSTLRVMAA